MSLMPLSRPTAVKDRVRKGARKVTVFSALGVIFVEPLAVFLGSTQTILPYAASYLRVIFIGAPFMMGSFCLNNHMRFQGSANIAMIGIVTGAVLNIALDPLMIFTMKLGITGAALATILSQMISFFLLLYLNLKRATIKVNIKKVTISWHYFKNILKGGIPSLVRQGIGSVATILLNKQAGLYGAEAADAAIAAMGVVTRITNFAYAALIGFGQGFQPVCGTNYGAKNYKRVKEAFFYCVKVGSGILFVISVLGMIFAKPLVAVFRDDPDVIRIGATALRVQWIAFTLNAYVVVSTMLLQTIGMPLKASIVAMARQGVFFVPLVVILPQFFGLFGVQCAQAVADFFSFFLAIPLCQSVLKTFRTDAAGGGSHGG